MHDPIPDTAKSIDAPSVKSNGVVTFDEFAMQLFAIALDAPAHHSHGPFSKDPRDVAGLGRTKRPAPLALLYHGAHQSSCSKHQILPEWNGVPLIGDRKTTILNVETKTASRPNTADLKMITSTIEPEVRSNRNQRNSFGPRFTSTTIM